MNRLATLGSALALSATAACTSESAPYLSNVSDEAPGTNCAEGGKRLDFGQDDNADRSLAANEVSSSTYLCEDALSQGATLTKVDLPLGDGSCPSGGYALLIGVDSNNDEVVDNAEGTRYLICNGESSPSVDSADAGAGEEPAAAAKNALINVTSALPNAACAYGGTRIDIGSDQDADEVLDEVEITSTQYICDRYEDSCTVFSHEILSEDDRGPLAVTGDYVFYNGDDSTIRADIDALQNMVSMAAVNEQPVPFNRDGLFSDLATGTLYSISLDGTPFSNDTNPCGTAGQFFTKLLTHSQEDLAITSTIDLSLPIPLSCDSGLLSGDGIAVITTPTDMFKITMATGAVENLGPTPTLNARPCETWAFTGFLHDFGEDGVPFEMIYAGIGADFDNRLLRTDPAGNIRTLKQFIDLGELCMVGVSHARHRWYFHVEGESQLSGTDEEHLGSCVYDFLD